MSLRVPVTFASIVEWVRLAANSINGKQNQSDNLDSIAALTLTGNASKAIVVNLTEDGFILATGGGGGSLADGDYGDITVSGTGTALTIDNDVVTPAKMANVATATVFYRKTAGTGDPEVNTLATLKTDLGLTGTNSGDQTITLSGDVSGSGTGAITTTIGAGKVTLAMQANMATASVVYRKTAGSGAPEVQTLATLKTDLGLTGTNSGDQTITLTGDVTGSGTGSFAATIASNAVTTTKINNSAVTLAKIANASANSKLLGAGASGSGAAYAEIALGTGLSMSGTTLNATASGGAWALTGTGQTATGVWDQAVDGSKTTVAFAGLAGANDIMLFFSGLTQSVSGVPYVQVSVDNGSTWFTTSGDYKVVNSAGTPSNSGTSTGLTDTSTTGAITSGCILYGANLAQGRLIQSTTRYTNGTAYFTASTSAINAIRVGTSGGGSLNGGKIYCAIR